MSELKAVHAFDVYEAYTKTGDDDAAQVYLKSEADKEIARNKYKRCLAMAEMCMHKRWRPDEGFDYARSTRHMNKWRELAEKFKPNNSTAQQGKGKQDG